jgi:hypothetical protein
MLIFEYWPLMQTESHSVRPDAKGRITLGKLAKGVSSFRVSVDKEERIILEPYHEIPARERWLYKNKEALASVLKGLQQSKEGKTRYLGSLAQYLDEDDL